MKTRKLVWTVLVIVAMAVLLTVGAMAAPAVPGEHTLRQPNGQAFNATLHGDAFFNYAVSDSGAVLEQTDDGTWAFAGTNIPYAEQTAPAEALTEHALIARQDFGDDTRREVGEPFDFSRTPARRSAINHSPGPFMGIEQNLLVLLVEFTDAHIAFADDWAYHIFTGERSVAAWYDEISEGAIQLVPAPETQNSTDDGIVRVRLNRRHPNTAGNSGQANARITHDALRAATAAGYINPAAFDRNGDRIITNDELHILVIVAGYEAAWGNTQQAVWAHYWNNILRDMMPIGGVRFSSYSQIGERHGRPGNSYRATNGIIVHELGHSFGLPDLYGAGRFVGLGDYCVMASGSWAALPGERQGASPTGFSAYALYRLGLAPVVNVPFGADMEIVVNSLCSGERNLIRIDIPGNEHQFFLIENRQLTGWDAAMGWIGGLGVYRVDTRWRNNIHQRNWRVTMLEANEITHGHSQFQNGIYNASALFFAFPDGELNRATVIDRSSRPAWGVPGSWMRFEVLCEIAPEMMMAVQPLFTVLPASEVRVQHRSEMQLQAHFAQGNVTWQANGDVTVSSSGVVNTTRALGSGTVTATDGAGNTYTVEVQGYLNWWQWLIWIFLLGFLWY